MVSQPKNPMEDRREQPDTQGQPSQSRLQSHGGSQNPLHHGVRETAKTSDVNSRSRRAANQPGFFPREGPSCSFAVISSPVLTCPWAPLLLMGFFSLLTRDTNWNHLFSAAPCAEKTSFPTAPWSSRPPSHPHTPKIVAAVGTEQRRYLKREKLDLGV